MTEYAHNESCRHLIIKVILNFNQYERSNMHVYIKIATFIWRISSLIMNCMSPFWPALYNPFPFYYNSSIKPLSLYLSMLSELISLYCYYISSDVLSKKTDICSHWNSYYVFCGPMLNPRENQNPWLNGASKFESNK